MAIERTTCLTSLEFRERGGNHGFDPCD